MSKFANSPVEYSRVSSGFGPRNINVPGASRNHKGIDLAAPHGTRVEAFATGKVIKVGNDPDGYGKYVTIDHGNGFTTLYAHLSSVNVKPGQQITSTDQMIGKVGSTGTASGPHLHFEVRKDNKPLNPRTFLEGRKVIPEGLLSVTDTSTTHDDHRHEDTGPAADPKLTKQFRQIVRDKVEYKMTSRGLRNGENWREGIAAEHQVLIENEFKRLGLHDVKKRIEFIDSVYSPYLNKTPQTNEELTKNIVGAKILSYMVALIDRFRSPDVARKWDKEDFGVPPSTRSTDTDVTHFSPRREFLDLLLGREFGTVDISQIPANSFTGGKFNSGTLISFIFKNCFPEITPNQLGADTGINFALTPGLTAVTGDKVLKPGSYIATWQGPNNRTQNVWIESGVVYSASEHHGEVVKYIGTKALEFVRKAQAAGASFYQVGSSEDPAMIAFLKRGIDPT